MSDLKQKALTGARWTAFGTVTSSIIPIAALPFLARLLTPEAYGTIAVVMVATSILSTFLAGLPKGIIPKTELTSQNLSSLFWLMMSYGVVTYIILWTVAPWLANIFNVPQFTAVFRLVGLTIILDPIGFYFRVLFRRQLLFKPVTVSRILTAVTTPAVALKSPFHL